MAHEITTNQETGLTLTARLVQGGALVGSSITMTESGTVTGHYTGDVPGGTAAGIYDVIVYNGSTRIADGTIDWDGTAERIAARAVDVPTAVENADALLNRDMATGTDSGSPTVRTVRQALRALRNKWTISGTTYTVYREDDSTASWSSTVSTTAGADAVSGNDPA